MEEIGWGGKRKYEKGNSHYSHCLHEKFKKLIWSANNVRTSLTCKQPELANLTDYFNPPNKSSHT